MKRLLLFILLLAGAANAQNNGYLTVTNGTTKIGNGSSSPNLFGTNAVDGSIYALNTNFPLVLISQGVGPSLVLTNSNGDGSYLKIVANNGDPNSQIQFGTGLVFVNSLGNILAQFDPAGDFTITGQFTGNGAGLTSLNASQLASGIIPAARITVASALTAPSLTITGASPGTLILSNAAGTDFVAMLGTNTAIKTNVTITAGTRTFTHDSTHTVITNTATLTSSEWTAGTQKEWYNGTTTLTIDKTNGNVIANGQVSAAGITNTAATASTLPVYDANKNIISLANGGANTVVHGTSPPTETAVVEADLSLIDVTTANASTSAHGFVKKLPNDATKYYDGTGNYTVPAGSGGSGAATTITQTNFVLNTVYTNGSQAVVVRAAVNLNGPTTTGSGSLSLKVDNAGGTTFALLSRAEITTAAFVGTNDITGIIAPSGTYYFTNDSNGAGASGAILAGSGQIITVSSGTNGATGATGATGAAGASGTSFFSYSGNDLRNIGGGGLGTFALTGAGGGSSDSANSRSQKDIAVQGTIITNFWSTAWNQTLNAVVASTTNLSLYISTNGVLSAPPIWTLLGDSVTRVTNSGTSTITVPYGTRCCIVASNNAGTANIMQFGWSFQVLNP